MIKKLRVTVDGIPTTSLLKPRSMMRRGSPAVPRLRRRLRRGSSCRSADRCGRIGCSSADTPTAPVPDRYRCSAARAQAMSPAPWPVDVTALVVQPRTNRR